MRNVHIDYTGKNLDYQHASALAREAAVAQQMQEPTIISWHQQHGALPYYDGANPDTWWEKYGEGNGGRLEISVGDEFAFVMMDTRAFERVGEVPLRNLTDAGGNQFMCWTPLLGNSATPTTQACNPLDDWTADQY